MIPAAKPLRFAAKCFLALGLLVAAYLLLLMTGGIVLRPENPLGWVGDYRSSLSDMAFESLFAWMALLMTKNKVRAGRQLAAAAALFLFASVCLLAKFPIIIGFTLLHEAAGPCPGGAADIARLPRCALDFERTGLFVRVLMWVASAAWVSALGAIILFVSARPRSPKSPDERDSI